MVQTSFIGLSFIIQSITVCVTINSIGNVWADSVSVIVLVMYGQWQFLYQYSIGNVWAVAVSVSVIVLVMYGQWQFLYQ